MFDNDFERTKEYLKGKLADYLRDKGINPNTNFRCLNPSHNDQQLSMSYDVKTHSAHCFTCGATYDIFDLVGLDYNLTTFKERLNKLQELYLAKSANTNLSLPKQQTVPEILPSVTFGLSNEPQRFTPRPHDINDRFNNNFYTAPNESNNFKTIEDNHNFTPPSLNDLKENVLRPQGALFGIRDDNNYATNNNDYLNNKDTLNDLRTNYSQYLKQVSNNVANTDYFVSRGLSSEIIEKFSLGFDEKFVAGINNNTNDNLYWSAAIIPYNDFAFIAYNTNIQDKDETRSKGQADLFNLAALNQTGSVFITLNEFDALSLETLGYKSIAINGMKGAMHFLDKLATSSNLNRMFYISVDNQNSTTNIDIYNQLLKGLTQLQITYKRVNLAFPYNTINEALINDRSMLANRLTKLDEILAFSLKSYKASRANYYIQSIEDLYSLKISCNLYALYGEPTLVRVLTSNIIKEQNNKTIYAATANQWQYIYNNFNSFDNQSSPFANYINAKFIEIKDLISFKSTLQDAIIACHVQNDNNFVLFVDLLGYESQAVYELISFLGSLSYKYQQKIVILASEKYLDLLQGHALQSIKVAQNENDVIFTSFDKLGQPINFTMSKYYNAS